MNAFNGIGRLTKDTKLTYTSNNKAFTRFSLAINRRFKSPNGEYETDFLNCICWGKVAENVDRFVNKGDMVAVQGRIQTGSYEKDGIRHYTTDVVCDNVEFLETKKTDQRSEQPHVPDYTQPAQEREAIKLDISSSDLPF